MADLSIAVIFTAIDRLSSTVGKVGSSMTELGERITVASELARRGAESMNRFGESLQEPAINMQRQMATMAAITGLSGQALGELKERAIEFSATHPGTTAEEWIQGFTRFRGIFQDTAKAMQAEDVAAMLGRLGVDTGSATRLIQTNFSNLNVSAQQTGDQLTRAIRAFGLAPEATGQFAMGVARMSAAAAASHAPLSEVLAITGEANRLMGGGRGAMMMAGLIKGLEAAKDKGEVAIDFSHGLVAALQDLRKQIQGPLVLPEHFYQMGKKAQARYLESVKAGQMERLAALGIGDPAQWANLLNHLDEVTSKNKEIANSATTLQGTFGTATNNMADAEKRLSQNWSNFKDALSTPALPVETGYINQLSGGIQRLTALAEAHPVAASRLSLAIRGIGAAAYYAVEGMSTIGTSLIIFGKGLEVLRGLGALTTFTTLASGASSFGSGLLALATGPVGLTIAAIAGLAIAAYEVYEHWDAVKAYLLAFWGGVKSAWSASVTWVRTTFATLWTDIKKLFTDALVWMKDTGIALAKALGQGLLDAIEWPVNAAKALATKIAGYFKFHSPPAYGPIREALQNFKFSEELAARMRVTPVLAAGTALAAAMAMPIGPMSPATRTAGTITINVNYAPTFNGATSADFNARRHADEIVRLVSNRLYREARLRFE